MAATDTADTTARGLLMPSQLPPPRPSPRLPPTTAVPMADTDMVDTTERGLLKPSPTTAMVGMVDTDTAMARGLLTPRLTTVTLATVMVDTMASVPLMPRPSPRLPPTTAVPMADTDMVDTLTASKMLTSRDSKPPPSQCNTPISKSRHPSQKILQNPSQNLYP